MKEAERVTEFTRVLTIILVVIIVVSAVLRLAEHYGNAVVAGCIAAIVIFAYICVLLAWRERDEHRNGGTR